MPQRHIEARAGCGDLHVRGDHGLAAGYSRPHRVAEHRVAARAAVLHLAIDANERALAVGHSGSLEQQTVRRPGLYSENSPIYVDL